MGKGTIISGGTDGQYQVSVIYNTDRAQAEKTANLAKIASLETQIAEETDDQKLNILKLQKLSLEKRNEILDNIPESETISAWCADFTEDLTGDVGVVEVPGESVGFNIQPGHEDNAVYDAVRDGQLFPTMGITPAAAFYNLAMLPGWQKWKPTYRYGTITAITDDTANVTLETATSTQQGLDVNQELTLTGVPVEYMTCDGAVFEVWDEVLIQFRNQDWTDPVIVGFKDNPKACGWWEYWDGGAITANHPWDTWKLDTSENHLLVGSVLTMSHSSAVAGSAQTGIYWIHTNGDPLQPSGLTLKIKCSATISGGSADKGSSVSFVLQDRGQSPQVNVEFYLAYDFVWSGGAGKVDASGSADEQVFDLSAYGIANPDSLAFEMNTISWKGATVAFEWDYMIIQ